MEANENEKKNGTGEVDSGVDDSVIPNSTEAEGDAIDKEMQTMQKELLYLRAEFDNYKKRIIREQDQAIKFANEKLIREVLGVAGHLERGVAHGKELQTKGKTTDKDFENLVNGIDMTQRELAQLLGKFGVEFIGTPGEAFDPNRHEAISQQETNEAKEDTVLHVLQKGSLLHGRLLVPAKVVVAKSGKES